MAEVALESVAKTFPGGVQAVRGVDLVVADGEFIVLVGPSGCGKTTTLRMIAGLEEATSGTIRIGGRVVNNVHPKDRDIAMVFQDYALYPHMTVRKNLSFALRLRRTPKDEIARRVETTAGLLGLSELLDRKPGALSGGQQQRVALGRAIIRNPACFLFDEPLSNLDAKLRMQTRAELKALHLRLRTTTIHVTHDQEEAMTLGDRLVVMAEGAVQQIGRPLEVYRSPANRFVAGFLGSPPMNFIEGTVETTADGARTLAASNLRLAIDAVPGAGALTAGGSAVLGLRPEHLTVAPDDTGAIEATATVTEPLGDRTDVYAETAAGTRLVARVDPSTAPEPGTAIRFAFDSARAHLFQPGTFGARVA